MPEQNDLQEDWERVSAGMMRALGESRKESAWLMTALSLFWLVSALGAEDMLGTAMLAGSSLGMAYFAWLRFKMARRCLKAAQGHREHLRQRKEQTCDQQQ